MHKNCIQCKKCLKACPVVSAGYRSFLYNMLHESETLKNNDVWQCANCWRCFEECPQGIDLWSIKLNFQRDVEPPEKYLNAIDNLKKHGFVFPINQEINEVRSELDLEEVALPESKVMTYLTNSY